MCVYDRLGLTASKSWYKQNDSSRWSLGRRKPSLYIEMTVGGGEMFVIWQPRCSTKQMNPFKKLTNRKTVGT